MSLSVHRIVSSSLQTSSMHLLYTNSNVVYDVHYSMIIDTVAVNFLFNRLCSDVAVAWVTGGINGLYKPFQQMLQVSTSKDYEKLGWIN